MVQWLRLHLPMQGVQVQSPGWGAKIQHALWPINQSIKQTQCYNKFNKDFKNEKKKILSKKYNMLGWGANGAKLPTVGLWLNASKSESRPGPWSLGWPQIACPQPSSLPLSRVWCGEPFVLGHWAWQERRPPPCPSRTAHSWGTWC